MHMKLNFRRLLAMFLSIVMVAGMLPAAVFAEDGVETQSETYVAQVGEIQYTDLQEAINEAQAGDEIILLCDTAEDVTIPAGVIFNGNGKQVGKITAAGEITFTGHTKATNFSVQYTNTTIHIGEGACLEITGTERMVIGHGCTFNITGTITDAKTANTAALTPSLIMPGASFTGAGVTFNVTNAYIKAPSSYCSSSKTASGTFDFNITNSIIETAGKLAFEAQSTAATVNFELKNSVLTTGSHLVFGVSLGEIVIDNSNVNVGTPRQIENRSTMIVKNGSVVNGVVGANSNAKNPGTLIIDNATYAVTGEFSGSDLGTGTLIVNKGASFTAGSITKANIQIDATGMQADDEINNITANLSNHVGTIEVVNSNLGAEIVDGKIVLVEAGGLSGEGTAEDPYLINNLEDLIWFRDTVDNVQSDRSNQFLGKYVKLTADIDLAGINWNPIGEKKDHGSFMGIFDGGDHTISNLSVEQAGEYLGLFAYTGSFSESEQAVIKNLTLRNVTVKSTNNSNYVGGLVGNATTTNFENIHVTGTVEISGCGYIGGIVGHGYSDFDNVSVKATNGTISSTFWCAGGVIGYLGEGSTIKNAVVEDLTIKSAAGGLGSIVGMAEDNNGTQPCTGENLSAKNVAIQTYTGVYGDGYAENGLGYLIGGDTSVMTGSNTVENVTFACSNGTTNPDVSDAVASVNGTIYFDLQTALDAAAAGTGNITVEILRDVNLNGVDWNPVTVSANGYPVVTVNGNNKTITGLNDMLFAGTWAGKSGLIINDLTIKDSNIVNDADDAAGTVGVGAFIGFPQASETITLINCHLVNSIVKGGHWTGGLIGYAAGYAGNDGPVFMNLTIKDCSVTGSTITGKGSAGGVIGHGSGNGWTKVVIENTTVSGNNITSTGSSTNKAGSVMGTIGAAGQPTTVNGVTLTGGAFVSATVSGNTVTSAGTTITTIYGRQGTVGGTLEVTGGSYDKYPIEENVSYAAPAEGYVIEESADGTYGLVIAPTSKTYNVSTKADLDAAIAAAAAGDTILLTADIDYGTDQLKLEKAITLDLGGKTLTTRNAWGGMSVKNNPTIKNGTIVHASNTAAIKVWNATAFEDLVIDVQGKGDANKTIGGIVLQEGSTTHVGSIKNVTIKGVALTNGIETYNCGNATEPVIGSMENVTIDAKSVGLNISAPCGTATNCSIKGGINGIEIWIKGTYSATLNLVNCNVVGGVFAHDEFNYNPSIVKNGTLKLTADTATTGASEDAITLTIARAEKVEGILKNVMDNAQAKVNDTYYATLASAIAAAQNGDIITLIWAEGDAPIAMNGAVYGKTVTITGTAIVDWSKGNLFVGRGGEGNGTVIFDNANLTSASNSSSYGIHVSGREKNTTNKYDGTLIIKNSTIELDYLINRGTIELDKATLTVKNGFGIAGRPASETESGTAATATVNITNGSYVKVLNHNGMGVGVAAANNEGYGVLNLTDSTFECASFNINDDKLDSKTLGDFNVYGESTLKIDTLTGREIDLHHNAIIKDSTVGGEVMLYGKVTFRGANTFAMLYDYGAAYSTDSAEWLVEAGASVTLTDKARYGLGYGDKVVIYGDLTDALNARETLTDDDIVVFMHGLVAMSSWNVENSFEVNNAYVVIGSNNSFGNTSKDGYTGKYTFAFNNSVVDFSRVTFYNSASTTELTFNKSDVRVGQFMNRDADSVFYLINSKVLSTSDINGTDEGNYLAGMLVLTNSSLSYAAPLEMEDGTLTLGTGSSLIAPSITGTGKIIIDAAGMTAGKVEAITANASGFTGTLEVINNVKLTAKIDGNGDIVLVEVKTYVAQIGEEKFETVAAALAYAKEQGMTDVEITLIGETESNTTDSFDLLYTTLFNSVTFKQEDPTKTYYLYDLYTGVRTNGGKFIFDGVNITVTDQYMFQGNVELINNSKITSTADANCFFYYADVIVNGGSSIKGVIEDIRGGTLTIDGGKTDGTYAETPSLQDAIFIVNWADSNLVLQNGAYVKINAANEVGRLTVNGTLNISDSKLDSYQWIAVNAGATLTVNGNSTITTKEITGTGKIIIDAAGMTAGKVTTIAANASAFTGTLEVINNEKLTAEIDENGNIVLVAKEAELFDIAKTNMIMGQNLALMFAFEKSNIADADLSGYVAKVSIAYKDDRGTVNSEIVSSNWTTVTIGGVDYWCVTVSNLAAKEMDDDVTVTIYKGEEAISKAKTMSLRQYGEERLAASTDNLFKTTVVDMLNYGAEAQKYFEYNENNLANRNISAYQNLATTTVTLDKTRNIISDENNHFIASNVTFTSDIAMLFAIARESTAVSGKITFVNHKNGTMTTFVDSYEEIIANGKAAKKFVFTGMVVADIDQVISVEFYDAEGNVVISLTDSLDAYLGRVGSTSRMKALADAFGKFSTSAYAYLHK